MFHLTEDQDSLREQIASQMDSVQSLRDIEQTLRKTLQQVGEIVLTLWLEILSEQYTAADWDCPMCDAKARYERQRPAQMRTMLGTVAYSRAVYACECGHRHYPMDEAFGLRPNEMSAELERLAAQMGVNLPFAQASDLFEELTLVSLSDHSIDKAAQAYGEAACEVEQDQAEAATAGETPSTTPLRLYGSIDGGRVRTRAPKGEEQPWREVKIGAWFQARGVPPSHPDEEWTIQAHDISYYTDICPAEDFGALFWASGAACGAENAAELIILADGAQWIWELVDLHFPHAIQIVDWFHACEYLRPVAKQAFDDSVQQQQWLKSTRDALWHGELETVIAACQAHVNPDLPAKHDAAQRAVTYYTNNQHRMHYETYRQQGYQIGSGTIESAVKQIAAQRMQVSGARWNLESACLVAKARAAYLSRQWDDLARRREHLKRAA